MQDDPRIGAVLSGGGARGAYEAGAISVLGPALQERGERPTLFVGTSVGAFNAAYLASSRHLDAGEQAEGLLDRWREATKGNVIRPILSRQLPLTALRYAGGLLSIPGVRVPSLLDPTPLAHSLERWMSWDDLHHNVERGPVRAVAVVATAARTGRTVVFVETAHELPANKSHAVRYFSTALDNEHIRASAAIPILFPPVRVEAPAGARGWYVDGGTRLNTPIKPALDLGADRLVVIGTESIAEPAPEPDGRDNEPPDFGDGALHALHGTLVDPLSEDMRMLGNVNEFFAGGDGASAATRYRHARGKPPYRRVPYIFIAPERRGIVGELASEVFRARYSGLKGLRSPDFPLLDRLLGSDSPSHGELLSYLLFDSEFIEALIDLGRADATRWLNASPGPQRPWQTEPLDAFIDAPTPKNATTPRKSPGRSRPVLGK
ncbi:MAG TPA: patatin-like phospholipase family protein [Solirubrobacteraceae bacterium]